ncbi:Calcium/proton exchanger [Lentinula boryana]|uniref:Vacuolar calcium ion transporter n=1 Tax=Lentinula boryana TaxID=40481 RepID=A0ABQ8QKI2_9AGAR|nr:Calcium/proton exchanger [Lentinula boryana]
MTLTGSVEESTESRQPLFQPASSSAINPARAQIEQLGTTKRASIGNANMNRTATRTSFSLQRAKTSLLTPPRSIGPAPSFLQSMKSIIMASWLNVLLVCIPVSWALNFAMKDQHTLVFIFSFLAIIPLAKLLAFATDELSIRVGQTLAGLLNATLNREMRKLNPSSPTVSSFVSSVELIVAIIALVQCKLHIVQSSLIGSILSNLLLVLGMCFFAGGLRFSEQGFGAVATQLNSSLLTLSVIAVLLPAAFHMNVTTETDSDEGQDILKVSHGVALVLLFIYASYLFFQLYSHATLYTDDDAKPSTPYPKRRHRGTNIEETQPDGDLERNKEEEAETPQMSLFTTIALLVIVTVFVAVTAEWLVDSIDGLTSTGAISEEFVGIILLPIVGNAAEHVTAVTVSVKDKLTLSLGVAVGSSIQIALFVIPFIITLGWILGKPLTLLFDPYESITLFLAVLTVNYCVQDGKSNWLEGMILMCLYVILCVTFWYYPGSDPSGLLNTCT